MKQIVKLTFTCLMLILFSAVVHSYAKNYETLSEYGDDPEYTNITVKVGNVAVEPITGEITFNNAGDFTINEKPDTNTYIINENTFISETAREDMKEFVNGRRAWISFVLSKADLWEIDGNEYRNIPVVAVISPASNVVRYSIETETSTDYIFATNSEDADVFSLNIIESFDDEQGMNYVTRDEMVYYICGLLNMQNTAGNYTGGDTDFTDIDADHWSFKYIKLMLEAGVINGDGSGAFNPGEPITYEQAIKMIVCSLGYKPKAYEQGGYPTGYVTTAANNGITRGVSFINSAPVCKKDIAAFLNNALRIPVMVQTSWSADGAEYAISDQTALEMFFNLSGNITEDTPLWIW